MELHPQYYHLSEPIDSLKLAIRLRKIHGSSVNAPSSRRSSLKRPLPSSTPKSTSLFNTGDETSMEVGWQEKVFGPKELVVYSDPDPPFRRRIDEEYTKLLNQEGHDTLDFISEVMIYTYTDKDGFVPPSELKTQLTTTPRQLRTQLEDAVTNIQRKPGGNGAPLLGSEASAIQAHLLRDSPVRTFFVMAAVDVDLESIKRSARFDDGDSARNGEPAPLYSMYEKVLCAIRYYDNGTLLEIKPGFSEELPESGDESAYFLDSTLQTVTKEGARLTTNRFTTPRGSIFEYTIENAKDWQGDGGDEVDEFASAADNRDRTKVADMSRTVGAALHELPSGSFTKCCYHVMLELVSGYGFDSENLCTEVTIVLPPGWKPSPPHSNSTADSAPWRMDARGQYFLSYSTHIVDTVPCTSRSCTAKNSLGMDEEARKVLQFPALSLHSGLRKFIALGLTSVLGACLILSAQHSEAVGTYWITLVVILALLSASGGMNPMSAPCGDSSATIAHFSHPCELHVLVPSDEQLNVARDIASIKNESLMNACPRAMFQVFSTRSYGRKVLEGCGYCDVNLEPGPHETEVCTWRPSPSWRMRQLDFYMGNTNVLNSTEYAAMENSRWGGVLGRYGFRTEGSGKLRLRSYVVDQGPRIHIDTKSNEGAASLPPLRTARNLQDILLDASMRRNSRQTHTALGSTTAASSDTALGKASGAGVEHPGDSTGAAEAVPERTESSSRDLIAAMKEKLERSAAMRGAGAKQ